MGTTHSWKRGAAVAVVTAFALIGAACGDDDGDSTAQSAVGEVTTTAASAAESAPADSTAGSTQVATTAPAAETSAATTEPADVDPNGVLRLVANLGTATAYGTFDLLTMPSPAYPAHALVFDTLLRARPDGTMEPGLAKSADVIDPQTIAIELQEGVTFSDGTDFNADAVKQALESHAASQNFRAFAAEIAQLDTVEVEDPTHLTIRLKTPIAGLFYTFLARGETMVPSPTAVANGDPTVGAGPFILESLTPEASIRLVKNPDYFQADQVRLAAVEYVHAVDPAAAAAALLAGQADAMDTASQTTADALAGSNDFDVQILPANNVQMWGAICKAHPPLDDVRVRQALNYAIDRDAINQVIYGGQGEPMWGLARSTDPLYDPKFKDIYKQDLDKARQLLAEAGYPDGFRLEFFVQPGDSQRASEMVQQQWAEIGVELDLAQSQNLLNEFFNTKPEVTRVGLIFPLERGGLDKITRSFIPGGSGNICQTSDEELNQVVAELAAVGVNSPEGKELWTEASDIIIGDAFNIFVAFGVSRAVISNNIGNVDFVASFQGSPFLDVAHAYIKS